MATKGKMGRSTRLDDELSAKICEIVADGKSNTIAYRTVGLPARTFYDWLQYGRDRPDSDFGKFLAAYAEADGLREEKLVAFIMNAAQGTKAQDPDWRAAAFLLSKLYPDRYGDKVKIETESIVHLEVRGTVQVQAILANVDTDAIRQLRRAVDASDAKGLGPGVIPAPSS